MKVAFLGLGGMGGAMAQNLLKAGIDLAVWNRSAEPAEALEKAGARRLHDPKDAAGCDAVISMLADDTATRAVVVDSGLAAAMPKGSIHACMATISVDLADELAELHGKAGQHYVSAPVLGRTEVAAAAQLNVVAAGPPVAIAALQPLFAAMGRQTWPFGERQSHANAVKLAVNFSLMSAVETMAEAMALVRGQGVDPARLIELMTNTAFAAPIYKSYGAMLVEERYSPPSFKLPLVLKDIRLALAAAEAGRVPMPFAATIRDNLLDGIASGDGELDLAALARVSQRRSGQLK